MDIIPAVANNKTLVNSAEFVKLTIYNDVANTANVSIYTFSSSYKEETISGSTYSPMGGLLSVGIQQRDIRVTSADTTIVLSGIPADNNNIEIVLDTNIRGSKIEITRGFYNNNYVLTSNAHRFTGIVTSYTITEERQDQDDTFTVALNASSYKNVLENKISGRKTNKESWQAFYPLDTSMDKIYSLADQKFDFGMKPTEGASTNSTASSELTRATQTNTSNQT